MSKTLPTRPSAARSSTRPVARPEPLTPALPESSPASADVVPRLSITLKSDGEIDWDRMRDGTKAKLVELVRRDPKFQSNAGVMPSAEIFSEQWCAMIYDALGTLEASMIARLYKLTPEQAAVMLYTEPEKKMLTGPTRIVLNKYASSWLASYTDEAALVITLGTIHIAKLQQLRADLERAARQPAHVLTMPPKTEQDGD